MKVSLLTYSNLNANSGAPARDAKAIAEALFRRGWLGSLVCKGFDRSFLAVDPALILCPTHRLLDRGLANRFIGAYSRGSQESLFDVFTCLYSKRIESDVYLYLKPAFTRLADLLRNQKKTQIAWASTFHPRFNLQEVSSEARRHGLRDVSSYSDLRRTKRLERFYDCMDGILVQSGVCAMSYTEFGVRAEKLISVRGAFDVDTELFSPQPRGPTRVLRVAHMSHMSLIKGIPYLLDAWRDAELQDAILALGGPADDSISNYLDRGISRSIVRAGLVLNPAEFYRQADLFVSPSISDSQPSTILEAMSCGVPVAASNRCGASELISDGVDGFVYDYSSPSQLARILRYCADNRDDLARMGVRARQKVLMCSRVSFLEATIRAIQSMNSRQTL